MWRSVSLAVALVLVAPLAAAEQSDVEAEAYAAFERARRYFDAEDYLNAAQYFERAYELMPSGSVHYNIARSYELAEVPELSAQHYRQFLHARAGSRSRRRDVQERLDRVSGDLGWVQVDSYPEGARISVGEYFRGTAPVLIALRPGRHNIDAELDDQTGRSAIRVSMGQEREVTVELSGASPPAPEPRYDDPSPRDPHSVREDPEEGDGGDGTGDEEDEGFGVLHHGFFWAALGLTVASGAALAGVGSTMLGLAEEQHRIPGVDSDPPRTPEQQERFDELGRIGPEWEVVTTAFWVTTGIFAGATLLVAIFTDWSTLAGGGDAQTASLGWMPNLQHEEPLVLF